MGDSTIDGAYVVLTSGRFGAPNPNYGIPTDGFAGADHHNVAAAAYPVGTVIAAHNVGTDGAPGMTEFVYLQYANGNTVFTATSSVTLAAKGFCVPCSQTKWYEVTGDPDISYTTNATTTAINKTGHPRAVMAISTMTDQYYGWFWCGGVCPVDLIAWTASTIATVDTLVYGAIMASDLTADAIGIAAFNRSYLASDADTDSYPIGFAFRADT